MQSRCWSLRNHLLQLALLLIVFNVTQSQRATLGDSCNHNQFRCLDGGCLDTEKLCNGRRDCSGGEDEKGTFNWSCRSLTLAKDNCDPARQFRCRFGGCISRPLLCDGRVDCWGGGDEARDVCTGTVKPSEIVSEPDSGSRQTYPPPTTTTRRVIIESTSTRSAFPARNPSSGGGCPAIDENPSLGYKVKCVNDRDYNVECANAPSGTKAQYTCKKYFTATSSVLLSTARRCENGRWSPLNYKFGCEPECGISTNDIGAFVVGGLKAEAGRWPWMVAIYERNSRNNKMDFICGASLVSTKAIITAAHCVKRKDSGQLKSLGNLKIFLGKYYRSLTGPKSEGEQEHGIAQIFVHPDYNSVTLQNDIAIIKLSQPAQITATVRPVCLPSSSSYVEPGDYGTLIGWGRGTGNTFQEQLQQAQLPFVSSRQCIDAHPQFAQLVNPGTFCAGYRNGTSACDGDSGGPLVFADKYRSSKWILHGVVSAGIASSESRSGCNPNYYTVFSNVGYQPTRSWISFTIDSYFNF